MMRKVILYIAISLDGYIATTSDDISFLSIVEQEGEDYGYEAFIQNIDTVIMGRRTYEKVLALVGDFPHKDKETYIFTRNPQPEVGKVKFYTNSLPTLVQNLKSGVGKDIFVDGGAETVHELLKEHLIDEFYISIIPTLLGDGIPLFRNGRATHQLKLINTRSFPSGLVQLHYAKV